MKNRNTLQQQLYTVAFMILSVKNILDSSDLFHRPEWVDTLLLLTFFAFIGWKFILQRYTKTMLIGVLALGALSAFVSFRMHYFLLLFTYCGVLGVQNVDLKKVCKYTCATKTVMILMHVIPYIINAIITPENIDYIYRNGVRRQYFYLGHPNTFSMYVGWTLMEFIYAYYNELKNSHLVLIWLINFIVYKFTDSNTSVIVMSLCLVGFFTERAKPQLVAKIVTPIARFGFAICSLFFTVITIWFTSMPEPLKYLYLKLNDFLTGRLMFGAFTYEHFGVAWLGNPNVYLSGTTYFEGTWVDMLIFDNSYIYLLVYYGAIFLLIISLAFILTGKKVTTQRNVQNILIIGYTFYAIMEQYAINSVQCFPIVFVGIRLYEMYDQKRRQKLESKRLV